VQSIVCCTAQPHIGVQQLVPTPSVCTSFSSFAIHHWIRYVVRAFLTHASGTRVDIDTRLRISASGSTSDTSLFRGGGVQASMPDSLWPCTLSRTWNGAFGMPNQQSSMSQSDLAMFDNKYTCYRLLVLVLVLLLLLLLLVKDLKPANILKRFDGSLCLADFGVASFSPRNTYHFGTAQYNPPEIHNDPSKLPPEYVASVVWHCCCCSKLTCLCIDTTFRTPTRGPWDAWHFNYLAQRFLKIQCHRYAVQSSSGFATRLTLCCRCC
jgi:serine/threonine protein kinase